MMDSMIKGVLESLNSWSCGRVPFKGTVWFYNSKGSIKARGLGLRA